MDNFHIAHSALFEKLQGEDGRRHAIHFEGSDHSYIDLCRAVLKSIAFLKSKDIDFDDRVIVLLPDCPCFLTALFSITTIGSIAVPINPFVQDVDLIHIIQNSKAKHIISLRNYDEKIKQICLKVKEPIAVHYLEMNSFLSDEKVEDDVDRLYGQLTDQLLFNDYCYILYSSGTTGSPKGIPRRHKDTLICFQSFGDEILQMSHNDTALTIPKLSFGYGLGSMLFSFYSGGKYILNPETVNLENFISLVRATKPTILILQPRMLIEIVSNSVPSDIFENVRIAITAGEALPRHTWEQWTAMYQIILLDGFGSTEVGHIFISNKPGEIRPNTPGKLLNRFEAKIVDDELKVVEDGQIGRLWIKGESITRGYWDDPKRTQLSFIMGGFLSDDLFYKDEDQFLYPVGRADQMIKRGCGEWVVPIRIEEVLNRHPKIQEAIVIGRLNEMTGLTSIRAYVILETGILPDRALITDCNLLLANTWPDLPYYRLNDIVCVTDLPRNINGKVERKRLQDAQINHPTDFLYEC